MGLLLIGGWVALSLNEKAELSIICTLFLFIMP